EAFGSQIVRDEMRALDSEFRQDDGVNAEAYWNDMEAFYKIPEQDSKNLTVGEAAEKYQFSADSRDYITKKVADYNTLSSARDLANSDAESTWAESLKIWMERDVQELRDGLRASLADPGARYEVDADMDYYADAPPIFTQWRT